MAIRSFLAFELPYEIKNIVLDVSKDARKSLLNVKWVKVDNIHLTVVFMGNIRGEDITHIKLAVKKVCMEFGPFEISLKGSGVFPNSRRPRVLWLGLDGEIKRMSFLRDNLQKRLKDFGVEQEKRIFRPHLTLGRFRKGGGNDFSLDDILSKYKDVESPPCRLNEVVLYKSELRPEGAKYTKLESWLLDGKR